MLSIVAHREKENHLLVRAREKGVIEEIFPEAKVSKTPNADYLYRAVVDRAKVAGTMEDLFMNMDYDNFKNSIPHSKEPYHEACFSVWSVMNNLQHSQSE